MIIRLCDSENKVFVDPKELIFDKSIVMPNWEAIAIFDKATPMPPMCTLIADEISFCLLALLNVLYKLRAF